MSVRLKDLPPEQRKALKAARRAAAEQEREHFAWFCENLGLPRPVWEHRFATHRRWRFDYAWPDRMVALEVEGGVWTQGRHTRGKGYLADIEKYNAAQVMGWTVIRCTPGDLYAGVIPTLREALK